ncbi:MAG TPA: hypothetical protein VIQ24_23900 [Pyrinomonadaceae bacterium]
MNLLHERKLFQRGALFFAGLVLLCVQVMQSPPSLAQTRQQKQTKPNERGLSASEARWEEHDIIERAVASICEERVRDPQGSVPIDQMAAQHALSLTDPKVVAGRKRAQRLLPVAKRLVPSALSRLAADYNLEALNLNWIYARVKAVNVIKLEVEAHDNAYWRPSEPDAIIFGTIFLAGIRSDEAMITVLAHELTHAVNGTDQSLQPLFRRVEARASTMGKLPIRGSMAAELTCEAVGLQAMRIHTGNALGKGTTRRLARAVGKNCVQRDLADATHLSPRETLRVLLALEPELAMAITVKEEKKRPSKSRN